MLNLVQYMVLQVWTDVAEQDDRGCPVSRRQTRRKRLKHIQLGIQRLPLVHVGFILAAPPECFAVYNLETGEIDLALTEKIQVGFRKIGPYDAHQVDLIKKAGGNRCVRSCTAQHVESCLSLSFYVVQSYRTND